MGEEEGREGLLQHYLNGQVTKHNQLTYFEYHIAAVSIVTFFDLKKIT
jgi:hypothetical protein